jgi:hypothetical protein
VVVKRHDGWWIAAVVAQIVCILVGFPWLAAIVCLLWLAWLTLSRNAR